MKTIKIGDFKSGNLVQQNDYKSFSPSKICQSWVVSDPKTNKLLSEANRSIGSLDAFSFLVPDIDYFIRMHITKEATTSSRIEGTQTSMEEALFKEEDLEPEKRNDWLEVNNYVKAINFAIAKLDELPLSSRLIKETHGQLLESARGKYKLPGQFRTSQNWIGPSLKNADFVPPNHEQIGEFMSDLEKFINAEHIGLEISVPHLIKVAIVHYQFETIHPFLDGNGRIGRLLITLYLIDKKLLSKTTLYLSDFFEQNRRDYYEKLTSVQKFNDLKSWIDFFLIGIIETVEKSIDTFRKIIQLREKVEFKVLPKLGRRLNKSKALINYMYSHPVLDGMQITRFLGQHPSSTNRLLKDLENEGVLRELTGYKRNRIYAFTDYIDLFK